VTFGRGLETLSTLDRTLTVDRGRLMLIVERFDLDLTLELQWLKSLRKIPTDMQIMFLSFTKLTPAAERLTYSHLIL